MGKASHTHRFHPFLACLQISFRLVMRMFWGRTEMTSPSAAYLKLERKWHKAGFHVVLADWAQAEEIEEKIYELALRFFKVKSEEKDSDGNNKWVFVFWMDGTAPNVVAKNYMDTIKLKGEILVNKKVVFELEEGEDGKFALKILVLDKELSPQQVVLS